MAEPLPSQVAVYARFPIEVWEHVIDAVYDTAFVEVPIVVATLLSCALVCRAWRPRAQQVLFHTVVLPDKDTLYRFAELVDAYPKLGSYVRILMFRGYLHVPHSPAVLFLTTLRGRLANLEDVRFVHLLGKKAANRLPEGEKELPCLPFHRYFESLLTSVSHIRSLGLGRVRFTSFGEFARFLSALRNLQELYCLRVSWTVLGGEPACLAKRRSSDYRNAFLPNLKTFLWLDMDEEGRQRLLSALGPSLSDLHIKFPNSPSPPNLHMEHPDVGQGAPPLSLNIRSFPHLDRLYCDLAPFTQPIEQTLQSLRDTLVSWMPQGDDELGDVLPSERILSLSPWNRELFTQEQFVELLRTIGPIVEGAICRREPAPVDLEFQASADTEDIPETDPCMATLAIMKVVDRLEWEEWWKIAVAECFPTFARWKRLWVLPTHMETANVNWRDYNLTPQDYTDRLQTNVENPVRDCEQIPQDYTNYLQVDAESHRGRKQKTMSRFIAALGKLVPRRKVLKQF